MIRKITKVQFFVLFHVQLESFIGARQVKLKTKLKEFEIKYNI